MPSLTINKKVRGIYSAYRSKQAERAKAPFPQRSSRFSRLAYGLGFSLLTHLSLGLCSIIPCPGFNLSTNTQPTLEQELEKMEKPTIEKNESPNQDKAQYQAKLGELIARGKSIIEQFKKDRSIAIDYANFIIPIEYYGQRLEEKSYLMPKENLGELMQIVRDDLTAFGKIAKSNLGRTEKFSRLRALVYSKSVFDPGAKLVPSLLIPEGGQSCWNRATYMLILSSHFAKDLLKDGEEFVIGAYTIHSELGIFNHKLQTVHLFLDFPEGLQSEWSANIYHPIAILQRMIDRYENTSHSRDFLIAGANKAGGQTKLEVQGPQSPLSFDLPPSTYSNTNIEILRPKRTNADSNITAKRVEKVKKERREKLFRMSGIPPIIQSETGEEFTIEIISEESYEKMMKIGERYKMLKELQGQAQLTDEKMMKRIRIDSNGEIIGLDLTNIDVSDAGLVNLKGLTNLQWLNLSNTQISDAGLAQLKGLPNLRWLNLMNTQVSDAGLVHLKGLTNLQRLGLRNTQISDAGLVHLKGLPLQELYLTNTQVSDAGLVHLKELINLRRLNLSETQVSDAGLVHLKGLTNLQWLDLSNTQVSDAGLVHLKGLTNLQVLDLIGTRVSEDQIKELKNREVTVFR